MTPDEVREIAAEVFETKLQELLAPLVEGITSGANDLLAMLPFGFGSIGDIGL